MRRVRLLLPLLVLLTAAAARAETTVLASGGGAKTEAVPARLAPALPAGRVEGPLAWPLPQGDLLLLGRLDRDEDARRLAALFGMDGAGAGGYATAAWQDDDRRIDAVFADGPVALARGFAALETARRRPGTVLEGRARFARRLLVVRGALDTDAARRAWEGGATGVLLAPGATEAAVDPLAGTGVAVLRGDPSEPILSGLVPPGRALAERALHVTLPARWGRPGMPPRIPFVPDAVGDGSGPLLLVEDGPGAEAILAAAAPGARAPPGWREALLQHLPRAWEGPGDFLRRAARGLEAATEGDGGEGDAGTGNGEGPAWRAPLAEHFRVVAGRLPERVLEAPLVARTPAADDRLGEAIWTCARPLEVATAGGKLRLLALSDGRRLHIALQRPGAREREGPPPALRVEVTDAIGGTTRFDLPAGGPPSRERSLDREALAGEPYPGRVLGLRLCVLEGDRAREVFQGAVLVVP